MRLHDVESWLLQASDAYNSAAVVVDPWQAVGPAQRLRAQRVRAKEFATAYLGRLASTLCRPLPRRIRLV